VFYGNYVGRPKLADDITAYVTYTYTHTHIIVFLCYRYQSVFFHWRDLNVCVSGKKTEFHICCRMN